MYIKLFEGVTGSVNCTKGLCKLFSKLKYNIHGEGGGPHIVKDAQVENLYTLFSVNT
jgi:hypothetical protein